MPTLAKKPKTQFVCQQCGHAARKWLGKCPQCGEWNTFVEELPTVVSPGVTALQQSIASRPVPLTQVPNITIGDRIECGIGELDRTLGGGLVPGALVLLGGNPGIGKSTLLSQMLGGIAAGADATVLYVTGEESIAQAAMRAKRIHVSSDNLHLCAETCLERILHHAETMRPEVLAIDSIQTVHTETLTSIPGSIGQVRECAAKLQQFAKATGTPTIIVGHVTKDGHLAGPKTLEHIVDTVLHFDHEGTGAYRVLRSVKNRFGSTQELGVFEMRGSGLIEVTNPSALFLSERPEGAPGSAVVASADGSRPILVEIQALVAPASAGVGRRTATGVDTSRIAILLAVLAQRANCDVLAQDVFINAVGGVRLSEPAIDLGVACAVVSSARKQPINPTTVVVGEVGLAGEVRAIGLADVRIAEAAKLGFKRMILPAASARSIDNTHGLKLVPVKTVEEAIAALF